MDMTKATLSALLSDDNGGTGGDTRENGEHIQREEELAKEEEDPFVQLYNGDKDLLKKGNKFYRKFEYFENGNRKMGTVLLGEIGDLEPDLQEQLKRQEGGVPPEGDKADLAVIKTFKKQGSLIKMETKEMMPPPPSPASRRLKGLGTPKRDTFGLVMSPSGPSRKDPSCPILSPLTNLKSPHNLDLLQEQNIFSSDAQATPSHLFSPARQQEFTTPGRPRYQEIHLDYNPKSVEPPHLDTWLNSPRTPGTPAMVTTVGGPRTPGNPSVTSLVTTTPTSVSLRKVVASQSTSFNTPTTASSNFGPGVKLEQVGRVLAVGGAGQGGTRRPMPELKPLSPIQTNEPIGRPVKTVVSPLKTVVVSPAPPQCFSQVSPAPPQCYSQVHSKVSPEKVSHGSWRFSPEHPTSPFYPVVRVKVQDSLMEELNLEKDSMGWPQLIREEQEDEEGGKKKEAKRQKVEEKVERPVNYRCRECRTKCTSLKEVREHDCSPKIQCEDCKPEILLFQKKKTLLQHLAHSHPARSVQCPLCEKKTSSKTLLKDHVKKDHPTRLIELFGKQIEHVTVNRKTVEPDNTVLADGNDNNSEETEKTANDKTSNRAHNVKLVTATVEAIEKSIDGTVVTVIEETLAETVDISVISVEESVQPVSHPVETDANTSLDTLPDPERPLNDTNTSLDTLPDPEQPLPSTVCLIEDVPASVPQQSPGYICDKCGKGFNTSLRQRNHMKNCGVQKSTKNIKFAKESLVKKEIGRGLRGGRIEVRGKKREERRPNNRLEQLRVNWSEMLEVRSRCRKCGRDNYLEQDLTAHLTRCQGTLMVAPSLPCPHCVDSRLFSSQASLRSHVASFHTEDTGGVEGEGLASKHLFR